MKTILITGASGFIGSNLIKTIYMTYKIIAVVREDSDSSGIESFCTLHRYKSAINLFECLRGEELIGVIHLATMYIKTHKIDDIRGMMDSNITFGSEICEILALLKFRGWFINVGTFWQFYKNMPNNPLNLYAASKSAFECITKFYASTTNITFSTIYLNDTYGPNDKREKIFNLWLKFANSGESLEMSKGELLMDIIYIDDVVRAFVILIDILDSKYKNLAKDKIFALHSRERKTLRELADIFQEVTGKRLHIKWGAKPYMQRENFIPFEGGEDLPSWEEHFTLKDGIAKIITKEG